LYRGYISEREKKESREQVRRRSGNQEIWGLGGREQVFPTRRGWRAIVDYSFPRNERRNEWWRELKYLFSHFPRNE
jgi:hypothetical protein